MQRLRPGWPRAAVALEMEKKEMGWGGGWDVRLSLWPERIYFFRGNERNELSGGTVVEVCLAMRSLAQREIPCQRR